MASIMAGIDEWTTKTCIRFRKRTNETDYFILQMARGKRGFFTFSFLSFFLSSFLSLNLISDSVRLSHIKQFLIITEINWFCCYCCFSCSCFSLLFFRLGKGFWVSGYPGFFIQIYGILVSHYGYKLSPFSKLSAFAT